MGFHFCCKFVKLCSTFWLYITSLKYTCFWVANSQKYSFLVFFFLLLLTALLCIVIYIQFWEPKMLQTWNLQLVFENSKTFSNLKIPPNFYQMTLLSCFTFTLSLSAVTLFPNAIQSSAQRPVLQFVIHKCMLLCFFENNEKVEWEISFIVCWKEHF